MYAHGELFLSDDSHKFNALLLGHRPVIVKRAVIGSKGGWKLSTIFLSCKVFRDWSIIKLRKYIVFIRRVYLWCAF